MFSELTRDDVFLLETKRLWLRWPRRADASALASLAGDWDVARMTAAIPHPYELPSAVEFIDGARRANAAGQALTLAIGNKADGAAAIGVIGVEADARGARLGFWLGKPYWRRGLGAEAALAIVDAFFWLTNENVLAASARTDNDASRALLARTGFVDQGAEADPPGRCADVACRRLELTRQAWTAALPRFVSRAA